MIINSFACVWRVLNQVVARRKHAGFCGICHAARLMSSAHSCMIDVFVQGTHCSLAGVW